MANTHHFGESHNSLWKLKDKSGKNFENKMFSIVKNELRTQVNSKQIKICQTPINNDGGKDIIINSIIDFDLFGSSFRICGKNNITVYIECKSTDDSRLRYEKIIGNAINTKYDKIDYYVLLTNSTISPSTCYKLATEFAQHEVKFKLIDQGIIANVINNTYPQFWGRVPEYEGTENYYIEYQTINLDSKKSNKYEIIFLFRNYSNSEQLYKLKLITNIDWICDDGCWDFSIGPNDIYATKLFIEKEYRDGMNNLIFKLENHNFEKELCIEGIKLCDSFEPDFIGSERYLIVDSLFKRININLTDHNAPKLYCLWGMAGIGKTRIVNELFKQLEGTMFDVFECTLNVNERKSIDKLFNKLKEKEYIVDKEYKIDSFAQIFSSIENEFNTAVIFIDNFHYASKELQQQMKSLVNHNAPVIFILSGRTDYSEGGLEYYQFVQWSHEKLTKNHNIYEVKPLTTNETIRLIKSIINKIPDSIVDMLCEKSMNNPLFITQFIEYLLDNKLVVLKGKNTVDIVDITKLSVKTLIPESIQQIYEKRIKKSLVTKHNEVKYLLYLFLLATFDGEISIDTSLSYFDENEEITEYLIDKAFIIKNNGNYQFVHESLLIYINTLLSKHQKYRKEIAQYILSKSDKLLSYLSDYKMGRLYLWDGQESQAVKRFAEIIKYLNEMENISNINVRMDLYDYLFDVFEVCSSRKENTDLTKKLINMRLYITLHHLVPYNAVLECDKCLDLIKSNKNLKNDKEITFSINTQKAHSLLNSGCNLDGSMLLNDLLSQWIKLRNEGIDDAIAFDMIDRLSAAYIKFNCFSTAENFSDIEINMAENIEDPSLKAIAYRTRSKLFYLNNPKNCLKCLDEVDKVLLKKPAKRIELNNEIYRNIFRLTYCSDYEQIVDDLEKINKKAKEYNFNRAIIQSNMVLSAAYLKSSNSIEKINLAKDKVNLAINYSIRFGIPSYIWQCYNLLAIIETKLNYEKESIGRNFSNVFKYLEKQNLTYIGNMDICYSNILAISNVGIYLQKNSFENEFKNTMSKVSYIGKNYLSNSLSLYNRKKLDESELNYLYQKAAKREMLFSSSDANNLLKDDETGYFISLT